MDDILVSGVAPNGAKRYLSIGVRRRPKLIPSEDASVQLIASYLDVVVQKWHLIKGGIWRLALAVVPSCSPAHELAVLVAAAASIDGHASFQLRIAERGRFDGKVRNRLVQIDGLVRAAIDRGAQDGGLDAPELTWRLLHSLSIIELRLEGGDRSDRTAAVERLLRVTHSGMPADADALFSRLAESVSSYAPSGAVVDRETLAAHLHGLSFYAPGPLQASANEESPVTIKRATPSGQSRRQPRERWSKRLVSHRPLQPQLSDRTVVVRDGYWLRALDIDNGKELWSVQTAFNERPVVGGGCVYVADSAKHVLPRDVRSGKKRPCLPISVLDGLAVIDQGVLFAADLEGRLHAIDVDSRTTLWSKPLTGQPSTAPQVRSGVVLALAESPTASTGLSTAHALAIDAETGRTCWIGVLPGGRFQYWKVDSQAVYIVQGDGSSRSRLTALSPNTGTPMWAKEFDQDEVASAPVESGRAVYLVGRAGYVYSIDAKSGVERWREKAGRRMAAAPLVVGDTVFVGGADPHRLTAFDARTGTLKWHKAGDGAFLSAPFAVGNAVCAAHRAGGLIAWDIQTGRRLWSRELRWEQDLQGSPLVEDGTLYVTDSRGYVRALDLPQHL
ncbi:PQQ-binding-like beta-propeller repeat protein [Streptomyces erythrochromogenes]|uniref:PQQ-binding-like beta-propeller repeat protein n=1 Tax=Streptomyces erythrochromogenes TaxID=285574 RepID=UPI0033D15AA2